MPKPSLPPWDGNHFVGIDENGMGPRLGPLIVTSVLARARDAAIGTKLATSKPKGALAKRIGDSKRLVAFDDSALGEAWARALAKRAGLPHAPTPTSLIGAIGLDADAHLRAPCPSHHLDMCWSADGEELTAPDDAVTTCLADSIASPAKGLDVLRVRVAIVCTRRPERTPSAPGSHASTSTSTRWSA